jgi:hypothetical protein
MSSRMKGLALTLGVTAIMFLEPALALAGRKVG